MSKSNTPVGKTVALIAGPTASGKSDLAVELALVLQRRGQQAVVINADSAQVYRDLEVLSARPSEQDMRGIEHRLFGVWDGAEACSAADWATAAKREIALSHAASVVPILVGGTGLYLRTLLDGIAPVPPIEPAIREVVRSLPVGEAYAALRQEDPERAASLDPADSTRIARALEVVRSSGQSLSHWQAQRSGAIADEIALSPFVILPDRDALYARCDTRFSQMIDRGAAEEVEALLSRDLPPRSPVMRAIGVPQIAGWLRGAWSRETALAQGQQATRNYAKRQYTWFRGQTPAHWQKLGESSISNLSVETFFRHLGLT